MNTITNSTCQECVLRIANTMDQGIDPLDALEDRLEALGDRLTGIGRRIDAAQDRFTDRSAALAMELERIERAVMTGHYMSDQQRRDAWWIARSRRYPPLAR